MPEVELVTRIIQDEEVEIKLSGKKIYAGNQGVLPSVFQDMQITIKFPYSMAAAKHFANYEVAITARSAII